MGSSVDTQDGADNGHAGSLLSGLLAGLTQPGFAGLQASLFRKYKCAQVPGTRK